MNEPVYDHTVTIGELPYNMGQFVTALRYYTEMLNAEENWSDYWVDTVKDFDGTKWIAIIGKRRVDNDANV